jgi:hypothetical protein
MSGRDGDWKGKLPQQVTSGARQVPGGGPSSGTAAPEALAGDGPPGRSGGTTKLVLVGFQWATSGRLRDATVRVANE